MKKFGAIIAVLLALSVVLTACGQQTAGTQTKKGEGTAPSNAGGGTIKLGVITSQTGEKASEGRYLIGGIKMAVDEWNAKGGINGKKIEYVVEDDGGQTSGAVNAFNKVMSEKPVAVIAPIFSNFVLAMAPYVEQAGIPTITGGTNVKITGSGYKWFFRVRTSDGIVGQLAAKYATEDLKSQKPAILHDSDEFGQGFAKIIKAELEKLGKPPVAVAAYNSGDKDFSAQLLNFKNKGADLIIAGGHPLEAGLIFSQIKQLNLGIKVLGSASFGQPDALKLAGSAANGDYVMTDFVSTLNDPKVQDWVKKFKEKTGLVGDFESASSYDGTNILLNAIAKAGTKPEDIRKALLETKNYQGVQGVYSFQPNGDGLASIVILEIKDGKPVPIKVINAAK